VNILVIDDGSGISSQAVFDEVQTYQATVYHHEHNQGKGVALKTGIELIKENQPNCIGVVTADADGQHAPNPCFCCLRHTRTERLSKINQKPPTPQCAAISATRELSRRSLEFFDYNLQENTSTCN
jgi:hypothetical protein